MANQRVFILHHTQTTLLQFSLQLNNCKNVWIHVYALFTHLFICLRQNTLYILVLILALLVPHHYLGFSPLVNVFESSRNLTQPSSSPNDFRCLTDILLCISNEPPKYSDVEFTKPKHREDSN